MFPSNFHDLDPMELPPQMRAAMMAAQGQGRRPRRFDEYYRVYPVVMLSGPVREELNYGGKIMMPPSALEKLSRLNISYPMLFELRNGKEGKVTHAGVLEFIAEEGRVYLPYWMMQTLGLQTGDLLQVKSTDLPPGNFLKLQPQSMSFINSITDPKAVLENVLRNFAALTIGDIFQFEYNNRTYEIGVLEVKPDGPMHAITTLETDISVDFAPPLDYVEPEKQAPNSAGSSRPGSVVGGGRVTPITQEGGMSKSIGYSSLAPSAALNAAAQKSSAFSGAGQKLKGSRTSTPSAKPSTPVAGASTNIAPVTLPSTVRRGNGPAPLRLPHGQLFFGYEIKPVKQKDENGKEVEEKKKSFFEGKGMTVRGKKKKGKGDGDN